MIFKDIDLLPNFKLIPIISITIITVIDIFITPNNNFSLILQQILHNTNPEHLIKNTKTILNRQFQ